MSDRRQRMIEALNSLEVVDWSSSCGELEYVVAANTEENRKVLLDAGFTAEQIDEATDGGETDIDLTMLAMVAQIPTTLSIEEQNELLKKVAESYVRIINDLEKDCERYFDQRNRLIECLRFYERLARGREVNDGGRRARTLLAEIGVTVE